MSLIANWIQFTHTQLTISLVPLLMRFSHDHLFLRNETLFFLEKNVARIFHSIGFFSRELVRSVKQKPRYRPITADSPGMHFSHTFLNSLRSGILQNHLAHFLSDFTVESLASAAKKVSALQKCSI